MSAKTIPQARAMYRVCAECQQHPALSNHRGSVKRRRNSDLCFRCFRSLQNQIAAAALAALQRVKFAVAE